jgi:hypothetical protein
LLVEIPRAGVAPAKRLLKKCNVDSGGRYDMLRLIDFVTGRILGPEPGNAGRRPPCTPDLPKDPKPVRPPEPFCTTGPDLGKLGKQLKQRSKKRRKR